MEIKEVKAKVVKDSRGEDTIKIILKTSKGKFKTSAPSGKSRGKYEVKPYNKSLEKDIEYINKLDVEKLKIKGFNDLKDVEKVARKIGGNSLFCLEACLLKALAGEKGKELYELIGGKKNKIEIKPVGNSIGGGVHSEGKKPDFQEFLFISRGESFKDRVKANKTAYKYARKLLGGFWRKRNDEGAWSTQKSNEEVLDIMKKVREELKEKQIFVEIGLDVAASSFYDVKYKYKNPKREWTKSKQIEYIRDLIKQYGLFYVEDPLNEKDFSGFRVINRMKFKKQCLIVGDDLTVTSPGRLKEAIRRRAISGIIVKPNQIGSLIKAKEVIDIAKRNKIKTIISHRSGETKDNTIADLGVGWNCDFIKTGIYGGVRKSKLKRIINIEKER